MASGVTREAGYIDYSSTGATGNLFIPQIWAGKLIEKFYPQTCLSEIANTDYEGQIKAQGDTVIIRNRATMTIRDYKIGQTLTYEQPDEPAVELQIDKAKYFGEKIDDIDRHQSDIKLMDEWATDAAQQMKIKIEQAVFGDIFTDFTLKGTGKGVDGTIDLGSAGAPRVISASTVLDAIIDIGQLLDEANVPDDGRYIIIPPWFAAMIKRSDLRDASIAGDGTSMLRNGRLGEIDRFTLYRNNNLTTVTDTTKCTHCIAGHKKGLTFATQLTKTETLRAESTFGDLLRGLQVYGYKVIKPEIMADLYCTKG